MTTNQIVRVIPVLKVNNRNVNQDFYEETLGMKVLVEEGALLSWGMLQTWKKSSWKNHQACDRARLKGPKN